MSGIAGIFNLDGGPVDPALLRRMTDAIAHRGPDASGIWIDGSVGLGHRMLHTTHESLHEKQPLCDETGSLCLTLDGRVDNREELKAALEAKGVRLRGHADAELVLRAYECWAEECLTKIVGDFAFAIWDKRNSQLFCGRDFLGIKPFYYYSDGARFVCGSELAQIFIGAGISPEPNEGMIGEYLAVDIASLEETLYKGVFRLTPAHYLIVKTSQTRKKRYWDIDPAKQIKHRNDEEYAENFLDIFTQAVRCRLRSHKPVGVYLSGGLDSSSIVGVSQAFCRNEIQAAGGLEVFSMLFPGIPGCDESSYIRDVVKMWDLKPNPVYPERNAEYCYSDQVEYYRDFPDYPNGAMLAPIMAMAKEKGCRVLLTGYGGDEWFTGSASHCTDLLRQFRMLEWVRESYYESQHLNQNSLSFLKTLMNSFRPLVPHVIRRLVRKTKRSKSIPPGVDQQFADRIRLAERLCRTDAEARFTGLAKKALYRMLSYGALLHGREMQDRFVAARGLEDRHPFNDRRIVEYAFALPYEQVRRRGRTKFILREATQSLIPETVRQRQNKADFSHVFPRTLRNQGGERFFDSLALSSFGWVDAEKVRDMYREMEKLYQAGDQKYTSYIWVLWMVFGLELWVKAVFQDKAASQQYRTAN